MMRWSWLRVVRRGGYYNMPVSLLAGWTGGEVAAIPISGKGLGAGALACFSRASVGLVSMALASGAGKASEGKAVMLAGGSELGDIEACDGLGFG